QIADFALFWVEAGARLRFEAGDDLLHAVFAEDLQILERAGARPVGWDDGRLQPIAVAVEEKIIARFHASVHGGNIDTPAAELGVGRLLRERTGDGCGGKSQGNDGVSHGEILLGADRMAGNGTPL